MNNSRAFATTVFLNPSLLLSHTQPLATLCLFRSPSRGCRVGGKRGRRRFIIVSLHFLKYYPSVPNTTVRFLKIDFYWRLKLFESKSRRLRITQIYRDFYSLPFFLHTFPIIRELLSFTNRLRFDILFTKMLFANYFKFTRSPYRSKISRLQQR